MTGGTGASRRGGNDEDGTRPLSPCMEGQAWKDPWRPMAGRDPFTDPLFASQPSSRRTTLSASLQRMTYGPLRGRGPVPGGWSKHEPLRLSPPRGEQEGSSPSQERTCSRKVGEPRARASLPFLGENKRGLPILLAAPCRYKTLPVPPSEGGDLFSILQQHASPRVSPSQGRPRGVFRRRDTAVSPSVDRPSR